MTNAQPLEIIMVDDDADDRFIFKEFLKDLTLKINLTLLPDGLALTNYLDNSQSPIPDIIFLDINMPLKDGLGCLSIIKNRSELCKTWAVMYTTSVAEKDVEAAFSLGAKLYITKPYIYSAGKQLIKDVIADYTLEPDRTFLRVDFVREARPGLGL